MRGEESRFRSKKEVNAVAEQLISVSNVHHGVSGWLNGLSYSFDLAGSIGFVERQ